MSAINRKLIFDAAKRRGAVFKTLADVRDMDAAIDAAMQDNQIATDAPTETNRPAATGRQVSQRGIDLMHQFEGCRLEAYPDPGSRDGHPWTIGWGSTGPGISRGVKWTQAQADERFRQDLVVFAAKVDKLIGDSPTTQHQFDALVSLAYNIGLGALQKSTVLRKHKAGDYPGAAAAFSMWSKNDGKIMRGLVRRRAAEADLYDDV